MRGKTFGYGENGPVGLVRGKRAIVVVTSGNVYGDGSPYQAYEHARSLLRSVFSFIGVTDLEIVAVEGLSRSDEARAAALDDAFKQIRNLPGPADKENAWIEWQARPDDKAPGIRQFRSYGRADLRDT